MNETLGEAVDINFSATEIVQEVVSSTSPELSFVNLTLIIISIVLAFIIYKKLNEIFKFSDHEGVRYFRNTFLCLIIADLLFNLAFGVFFTESIIPAGAILVLASIFGLSGVIASFISQVYLLHVLFYRFRDKYFSTKWYKRLFIGLVSLGIVVETALEFIIYDFGNIPFLIFKIVGFFALVFVILYRKKTPMQKRITHPFFLGLIILILSRGLGNLIDTFIYTSDYIHYIVNPLISIVGYVIILHGLTKWHRRLLK